MKVKLQIVLIPNYFALIPTTHINPDFFKKFVHLVDPSTKISTIKKGLSQRFAKLYPEEDVLTIESYQDRDTFDLDPDFLVNEIFQSGDVLRIIVKNTFSTSDTSQQLAIAGPAPDISADESNISLPPPPSSTQKSNRIIPKKRKAPALSNKDESLPGKKRITSGMLVAPPPLLDDISGPESSFEDENEDEEDADDDDSGDVFLADVGKSATSTPTKKSATSNKDKISKKEVMDIFKSKSKTKVGKKSPSMGSSKRQALMKSLVITMNSDPHASSSRGTRAAKQAAEISLYNSISPPPTPSVQVNSSPKKMAHPIKRVTKKAVEKLSTQKLLPEADSNHAVAVAVASSALKKEAPSHLDAIEIESDIEYDPHSKLGSFYQKIRNFEDHLLKNIDPDSKLPREMAPLPEQRSLLESEILDPTIELVMNRPKKEPSSNEQLNSYPVDIKMPVKAEASIIDDKTGHESDLPSSEIENHGNLQLVVNDGSNNFLESEKLDTSRDDFHVPVVSRESSSEVEITNSPSTGSVGASTLASTVDDLQEMSASPVRTATFETISKRTSPSNRGQSPISNASSTQTNSIFKETTKSSKLRNTSPKNLFSVPKSNSIFTSPSNSKSEHTRLRERAYSRNQIHVGPQSEGFYQISSSEGESSDVGDVSDLYREKEIERQSKLVSKLPSIIHKPTLPFLNSKKHKSVTFSDIPVNIPIPLLSPEGEYEEYIGEHRSHKLLAKEEYKNGQSNNTIEYNTRNINSKTSSTTQPVVVSNAPKTSLLQFMKEKKEKKQEDAKLNGSPAPQSLPFESVPSNSSGKSTESTADGSVSAPVEIATVEAVAIHAETSKKMPIKDAEPETNGTFNIGKQDTGVIKKPILSSLDDIDTVAEVREKESSPPVTTSNGLSKIFSNSFEEPDDDDDDDDEHDENASGDTSVDDVINTSNEKFLNLKAIDHAGANLV